LNHKLQTIKAKYNCNRSAHLTPFSLFFSLGSVEINTVQPIKFSIPVGKSMCFRLICLDECLEK